LKEQEIELLSLARAGDADAIDSLLAEHKHLVVAVARKYYLLGGDKEDLIQEGMIGLFKAISTFDVQKSDNFSNYAITLIEREIISAIRRANSGSQHFLSDSVLIDTEDEFTDNISPESDLISEESTTELTHEIFEHLSKFERLVVEYYLKGYNYVDISKILNKPSKSIDNALSRIKKKLNYLKERL
jgi:RNA polymerase sporulation-specific sigma factor